jgi:predicted ATP-grasp superfamily ATP-dependent carboligase
MGFFSRYVRSRHRIDEDPCAALVTLEDLGRREGGVLIPTTDEYLILVSQNLERLRSHFVVTTPPWEVLGPLMDVSQCYELGREVGIRTPRFFKPHSETDMRSVVAELELDRRDYLLKTMPGSEPADVRTGRFTKVASPDRESIVHACLDIFARAGEFPSILEVIPGTVDRCIGVCIVADQRHEPVLTYAVRRLKLHTYSKGGRFVHPYEMGANVFCESTRDDEAVEAATRFVRRAGWSGPIAMEFRRDPTDERLVLIKADPRFVRATGLSTKLGLDMPTAVYRVFTGEPPRPPATAYPQGYAWLWFTAYLRALWKNRSYDSIRRELFNLARNFRKTKSVAYFDRRDPLPFLADSIAFIVSWVRSRLRRRNALLGARRRRLERAR